jgi:hypothetical protein
MAKKRLWWSRNAWTRVTTKDDMMPSVCMMPFSWSIRRASFLALTLDFFITLSANTSSVAIFCAKYTSPKPPLAMGFKMRKSEIDVFFVPPVEGRFDIDNSTEATGEPPVESGVEGLMAYQRREGSKKGRDGREEGEGGKTEENK